MAMTITRNAMYVLLVVLSNVMFDEGIVMIIFDFELDVLILSWTF
jgi:hypothetical protein